MHIVLLKCPHVQIAAVVVYFNLKSWKLVSHLIRCITITLNFQESTTTLNACTKNSLETYWMHQVYIYIYIYIYIYTWIYIYIYIYIYMCVCVCVCVCVWVFVCVCILCLRVSFSYLLEFIKLVSYSYCIFITYITIVKWHFICLNVSHSFINSLVSLLRWFCD